VSEAILQDLSGLNSAKSRLVDGGFNIGLGRVKNSVDNFIKWLNQAILLFIDMTK
jgi:hypothetical protein